jgi:hypothetical protein
LCKYSNIEREARRFRDVGLVEGVYFTVKMPEGGQAGYVSILKKGLACAAWLKVYGSGEQQRLAAEFVKYILQRAREEGEEVYKKAREIIEEGMSRGSLRLEGFEGRVEVGGRVHLVRVIGGSAELEEGGGGKPLLKIWITAEVDGVVREYKVTFSRHKTDNKAVGFAVAGPTPLAAGGRRRETRRRSKGPNGRGAKDTPDEGRHYNYKVLWEAPRRLQALRRARRRRREMAGGDGPMNKSEVETIRGTYSNLLHGAKIATPRLNAPPATAQDA